jgi:NADPH:quinone reductase-like Zn-dependent oxidoreductase
VGGDEEKMKAVIYTKYGSPNVLKLEEIDKPIPKDNEVLIRIHATTVVPMDWRFRKGNNIVARLLSGLFKLRNPILGTEFSGEIEAVVHAQ